MEELLDFLGFSNPVGVVWNLAAYLGMIIITVAVCFDKYRNQFFVWGPLILLLYAWLYLGDPILTGLQLIVTISGALNLIGVKKEAPCVIVFLTIVIYIFLLITGQFSNLWFWLGSFGLLGIAVGLIQLPHKRGFSVMALGGLLIAIYAFALQIWVFFVLNTVFFTANILELRIKIKE